MILKPILHKAGFDERVKAEFIAYVDDVVLKPVRDAKDNSNEQDALILAIKTGRVWHDGTRWRGVFSAAISKRVRSLGGMAAPIAELPVEIRQALTDAKAKFLDKRIALLALLATVGSNFVTTKEQADTSAMREIVGDCVDQFDKSTQGKKATPRSTAGSVVEEQSAAYVAARDYLVLKTIDLLRKAATDSWGEQDLNERLDIAAEAVVSRAGVVAGHFVSSLVAKTREAIAVSSGINSYVWVTMQDNRVRHDHKLLHGREFSFDNPPVVDIATGKRANPGEDYNCRCTARMILPE
jgi:SPP1 gp7 family putative phage head morphogenesis protein